MTNMDNGWEVLIEACNIFKKYDSSRGAFYCSHDELTVWVCPEKVSEEDRKRLEELSFYCERVDGDLDDHFYSFRFGSC